MATDVFDVFVRAGQTVIPGETRVQRKFYSPNIGSTEISVEIYKSLQVEPENTNDETSSKVGELTLELDLRNRREKAIIDVAMLFGGTFIEVEATEQGTNNRVKACIDFLL